MFHKTKDTATTCASLDNLKDYQKNTSRSGGWTAGVSVLTGSGSGGGDGSQFSCTSGAFSYSILEQ